MKNTADNNFEPGIPPWMWFFVLMFAFNLPLFFSSIWQSWETLNLSIEMAEETKKIAPNTERLSILSYPGFFTENIPGIAIFLGLFTIVFPHLRTFFVERKNNLTQPPESLKTFREIREFIETHAPGLDLKTNLLRPGLIFVYPNGYRKATVAVFSGFLMLWKTDREAAEAVLQHEIIHYQRGDSLFLGPASFLETTLKITLVFYIAFVALPYILNFIEQKIQLFNSMSGYSEIQEEINRLNRELGLPVENSPNTLTQILNSVFIGIYGLFSTTLVFLTRTTASFILPIAAVWSAEFNADYVTSRNPEYKKALLRELNKNTGKVSWWRKILFRLSHPPNFLRRFFLQYRDSFPFSFLLLLYPSAIFVRLGILTLWMFLIYQSIGSVSALASQTGDFSFGKFIVDASENISAAFASQTLEWFLITALLLSWSFAVKPWERFFTHGKNSFLLNSKSSSENHKIAKESKFKYFAITSAATGIVFLISYFSRK